METEAGPAPQLAQRHLFLQVTSAPWHTGHRERPGLPDSAQADVVSRAPGEGAWGSGPACPQVSRVLPRKRGALPFPAFSSLTLASYPGDAWEHSGGWGTT